MSEESGLEAAAADGECSEENSTNDLDAETETSEAESTRTIDGAVAIIYHEYSEGSVEFYLEEKPSDYAIERCRGKYSFVGGGIETTDSSPLEALIREFTEEVESKEAQDILIAELMRSQNLYEVAEEDVDGKTAKTSVYAVRIDSDEDWKIVKNSALTHDAGPKRVLTLQEVLSREEDDFAFTMGRVMFSFIKDNYPDRYKEVLSSAPSYAAIEYAPSRPFTPIAPLVTSQPLGTIISDPYTHLVPESAMSFHSYAKNIPLVFKPVDFSPLSSLEGGISSKMHHIYE